ncbi:AIPR family protein [Clostridium tyrobutyricum]|uniref:AIPR family protein n=1 Tax=Clostridium tyrobutyricum TaxID=1519 RepID=UPI001C3D8BF8|nr:AIPR family protein [Clostridium tyrobutyricum]MBV4438452.1 AIPR family protein [Clostridium tyrobutyricum]
MSVDYMEKQIKEAIGNEKLSTVELGEKFLRWVLSYLFDKSDFEIECDDLEEGVLICDGAYDSGIDAAFIENDTISIIQTKYLNSNSIESVIYFLNQIESIVLNGITQTVKDDVKEVYTYIEKIDVVYVYYITNDVILDNNWISIKSKIKEVENKIQNTVKNKKVRIRVIDINNIEDFIDESRSIIPKKFQGTNMPILLEKYFENKENNTIIAEVSLKNLASFIHSKEKYLFYSNIRNFLGKRNKVNKQIEETYNEFPKNFWFYNNGITIVCDKYETPKELKDGSAKIIIETPQIVNGCQTSSTIYSLWKNQTKEERNQQQGTILVKIIEDINGTKRKKITRYTNSQTAVTGKDFFALEEFHQHLQREFLSLGYNYIIQRKDKIDKKDRKSGNKSYSYLFDKKFKNAFFAKDIVQAFAAGIHFMPAKARSLGNLVPGGSYYDKLFNDKLTPDDPRYYLFPYSIMYYSKNILNYKSNAKLKSTNLLYVTFYFKALLELFKRIELVNSDVRNFIECNDIINYIDRVFCNKKFNYILLNTIDNILKGFLKDTLIKRKIGDNLPKFLKSSVENDSEVVVIIQDKIKEELSDNDEFDLDKFKKIILID